MKNSLKMSEKNSATYYLLAILFLLLPFLIISIYNHPSADDFSYSDFANRLGFWNAQIENYYIWTGRYTATALLTVNPLDYTNLILYRVLPVILLISFSFSVYYFLNKLLINSRRRDIIVLTFLILFLYIYYTPNITEAFYWMAGSITYQLASILSLLLFSMFLDLFRIKDRKKKIFLTIPASFLCVAIVGLNETSMLILVMITFILFATNFYIKKEPDPVLLILFLVTAAASAVVILAPGNLVRMAEKPGRFQLLFSITGSIKTTLLYIAGWLPMLLIFIALFSPLLNRLAGNIKARFPLENFKFIHLLSLALAFLSFIILCFFPSYWSQGGKPPARTVNVIYLLFIFGSFALSVLFFLLLQNLQRPVSEIPHPIRISMVIAALAILIVKPNNIRKVYQDLLSGSAYRYNIEMNQRYNLLEKCDSECVVPPIKNRPFTLFAYDLAAKPSDEIYWYNKHLGDYFGLEPVKVKK